MDCCKRPSIWQKSLHPLCDIQLQDSWFFLAIPIREPWIRLGEKWDQKCDLSPWNPHNETEIQKFKYLFFFFFENLEILNYWFQIFGFDDDLLRSVKRPESLVKEILFDSRSGTRRGPKLNRIGCDVQPTNSGGESHSKSDTQNDDRKRISSKGRSHLGEEIRQRYLKVHSQLVKNSSRSNFDLFLGCKQRNEKNV